MRALSTRGIALAAAAACFLPSAASHAADWTAGAATISLSATASLGFFAEPAANFGAGSYDIRAVRDFSEGLRADAGKPVGSPAWGEASLKPSLRVSYAIDDAHTLFVDASAAYGQTLADGDASPFRTTAGQPGSVGLEEAYIGFKSPLPFGIKGDSLVVKFGRQDFNIDDGFLVQLGRYDIGKSTGFYLYPHTAFDGWGTVRINTSPVRADIFVLRADVDNKRAYGDAHFAIDQPATDFAGFDIEWFANSAAPGANGAVNYLDRARYLTFTYFDIYSSNRNPDLYGDDAGVFWARRDGLQVFSLAGGGNLIPVKDTTLYFQYVRQLNFNPGRRVDASAFYIEPGYTFSDLAWSPRIYYRYTYFSGQPGRAGDPIGTKRSYDNLFLGGGIRNFYGNFGYGEIIGNMMTVPSNLIIHNVSLKVTAPFHVLKPDDNLALEVLGYAFMLDHPERVNAASRNYGKEIDVTALYALDAGTAFGFAAGIAIPDDGGTQAIEAQFNGLAGARPATRDSYIVELFVTHTF